MSTSVNNFGADIRKWTPIHYNNVESGVMNENFMTNYFTVSQGVCQGCLLSRPLVVLAVEMLAFKMRQDHLYQMDRMPRFNSARLIRALFHVIIEDIVNSFGAFSGLQLSKKKAKATWIGTSSNYKTEPLKFNFPK